MNKIMCHVHYSHLTLSSGGHFVQWSRTILAILVKGHQRNISVKLILESGHRSRRRCHLKNFIFLALWPFSSEERTILAFFVDGHPRNIPRKLFRNWANGILYQRGDVI